jgi:hypothetical protein
MKFTVLASGPATRRPMPIPGSRSKLQFRPQLPFGILRPRSHIRLPLVPRHLKIAQWLSPTCRRYPGNLQAQQPIPQPWPMSILLSQHHLLLIRVQHHAKCKRSAYKTPYSSYKCAILTFRPHSSAGTVNLFYWPTDQPYDYPTTHFDEHLDYTL